MASALDTGAITPDFTYVDQGKLEVGGVEIQNWDKKAYGTVDATGDGVAMDRARGQCSDGCIIAASLAIVDFSIVTLRPVA